MSGSWQAQFPELAQLADPMGRELAAAVREVAVPAGTVILRQGGICDNYLLVCEGSVRVFARTESGREIVLYRIGPGESCILTTSCLFSETRFPAEGVAESPVTAVAIPAPLFQRGVAGSEAFRRFVFASYGERVRDLIVLVEQVAFGRVDVRLAAYLLRHAQSGSLKATHQELAVELGSAREVISRQLKELERRGLVTLGRGQVVLRDTAGLQRIAADEPV